MRAMFGSFQHRPPGIVIQFQDVMFQHVGGDVQHA
jgi:hypothetical protein